MVCLAHFIQSLPPPPSPPALPLKLALVGAPFSGKSTIANSLAQDYGLLVIRPEDLVARACALARKADQAQARVLAAERGLPPPPPDAADAPAPAPAPATGKGDKAAPVRGYVWTSLELMQLTGRLCQP